MGVELLKFVDKKLQERKSESFRSEIISLINEEFDKLNDKELGKVYKFIRRKLIAKI